MLRYAGILMVVLALPAGTPASFDIDVGMPPGTPLEWSAELFRPPTTARHGIIPRKPDPARVRIPGPRETVVQQRVPEPLMAPFGSTGLYDHFRVTTFDIMRHVFLTWPRRGKYDPDVPSEEPPDLIWEYPPLYPTEIYWSGALNALRAILHPEVVSPRELSAYLLEMGEGALMSSRSLISASTAMPLGNPLPLKSYSVADVDVAEKRPPVSAGESPLEQAIYRLVAIELTNAFPYAVDPTYARNTLALGRESVWALLEASRSQHAFLARNAVAVLSVLPYAEAHERLREIVREGKDPIAWVRAALGLVRHRDLSAVPEFEKWAESPEPIHSGVAVFALGKMADPRVLPLLLKLARETEDPDLLWSLLPAIARLADNTPEVHDTLKKLGAKRVKGAKRSMGGVGGFVPPQPEPAGTRELVFSEILLFARVAAGETALRTDFLNKVRLRGVGGFYAANQLLAIDVLRRLGPPARPALERVLDDRKMDPSIKVAVLNALRPVGETMRVGLHKRVLDPIELPAVRTTALLALAELEDPKPARETAKSLVELYVKRGEVAPPGEAAVVASAIQVLGGTEGGLPTKLGIDTVEKALRDRAWGFRVTRDSTNLNRAFVYSQPPLLEIAVLELGRTGDAGAIPTLARVLRSRAGGARGEAALALGSYGGPEATQALLAALGDAVSGWTRFNSYRALRNLSGQDHYDDWMFLPAAQLRPSIRKYHDWWKSVQK